MRPQKQVAVLGAGAVAAASLLLAGCGSSETSSLTPKDGFVPGQLTKDYAGTTITVVMPSWAATPADMLADFTEKTGIKVDMQDAGGDYNAMHDRFVTAAAAGRSMGDVIELGFDWVGQFGAAGWLTPLKAFVPDETVQKTAGYDAFVYDSQLIGVPYNIDIRGSMVNMTMFEAAGITEPPATWSELIDDAKKIKAAGVVEHPVGLPLSVTEGTSTTWYALQRASGAEVITREGKPAFADGDIGVQSLQLLRDLYEAGVVDPGSVGLKDVDTFDQFGAGASAFILGAGPGSLTTFLDPAQSTVAKDDIRFVHIPGRDDNHGLTLNFNEALAIPKASPNKEAAAMFIAWRSSLDVYVKTYLNPDLGSLPPSAEAITKLADDGKLLGGDSIVPLLDNVGPLVVDGPPTWYGAFSGAAASVIQKVALGTLTPDAGIAELTSQVTTLAK